MLSELSDRKIDFAIIHLNIENYDINLFNLFLNKLKQILLEVSNQTFRNNLKIFLPEKFPLYFVSENQINITNIKHDFFEFNFLKAFSLQEAVLKISPAIPKNIEEQIHQQEEHIVIQEQHDCFLYFEAIAPLLDIEHSVKLILDHFTYLAEYTYSDVAVSGFLPIVCNVELAKRITINEEKYFWNWSDFLLRNTQTLDLEIYYIEPDYRKYRIRFDLYNDRFQQICKNIVEYKSDITYREIQSIFEKNIDLIRIAPSYIELELTTRNDLNPKVYPKNPQFYELSIIQIKKILEDLKEFQLKRSFTLSLSGTGEPFLYKELINVLEMAIASELFHTIYIETFLYEIQPEVIDFIKDHQKQISLIVKLPTLNEELYQELMGINQIPKIKKHLEQINFLNVYAEILRIQQVEEELDSYFDFFKNSSIKPIVGRYNRYGNLLEDFSVVDLEPLEKDYCRSLMFHLFINANGKVPICRQDILCNYKSYDINQLSLKEIFDDLKKYYIDFINKNYNQILPLCGSCKDWYVFLG